MAFSIWHFYATEQIVIVVIGQRLNSNIATACHSFCKSLLQDWQEIISTT